MHCFNITYDFSLTRYLCFLCFSFNSWISHLCCCSSSSLFLFCFNCLPNTQYSFPDINIFQSLTLSKVALFHLALLFGKNTSIKVLKNLTTVRSWSLITPKFMLNIAHVWHLILYTVNNDFSPSLDNQPSKTSLLQCKPAVCYTKYNILLSSTFESIQEC